MTKVRCEYTELVPLHKLQPNPKNPNKHPEKQIKRLAEIIDYQGMRSPIVVSKRSGFITKGHGRLEALKLLEWESAPVDFQEYENDAQEYADIVADNAISEWASMDLGEINKEMLDLGPDLNIDMLGIEDFEIELADKQNDDPIIGDLEFSKEIDEKNDYIVLLFNSKQEFKEASDRLGIKTVKLNLSCNGNKNLEITGTGRVLDGKSIIDRL